MSKDRKWAPTHNTSKKGRVRLQASPPKDGQGSCMFLFPSATPRWEQRGRRKELGAESDRTPGASAPQTVLQPPGEMLWHSGKMPAWTQVLLGLPPRSVHSRSLELLGASILQL